MKKQIQSTRARIDVIAARKLETNAFAATGLVKEGKQYAILTNATYLGLFGFTASNLKTQRGLKPSASLRDNFEEIDLAAIRLSELATARKAPHANSFSQLRDLTQAQAEKVRAAIA